MGEKVYSVGNKKITFSGGDDEFMCLCTFPHNDGESLETDRLQSLAIFGAVVRLVLSGWYDNFDGEWIYIPNDVPEFILSSARKLVKGS